MALARLFFPSEAKLAMDIAHAETTSEFARLTASKSPSGNFREVDLNETPIVQKKRLFSRMEALMKTGNSCLEIKLCKSVRILKRRKYRADFDK